MNLRLAPLSGLGAALALALALASPIMPAFAAGPTADNQAITIREGGPMRPGVPAPSPDDGVFFLPDVRVNYLGKTAGSGGKVTYRFRVQNIGAASASNVGLGTVIGQDANGASISTRQEGSAGTIATLGEDQWKDVAVVCTPLPGYHCAGASLKAYVTDDLDTSNNAAHSS